MTVPELFY